MKRHVIAWALALLTLTLLTHPSPAQAQSVGNLSPELDARASELYAALLCPQCRGQSIGQSTAPVAVSMRQTVRAMLVEGASDEEILDFMVEAFGTGVLASPPKSGLSLTIWLIPPAALALGALALLLAVRSMRHGREEGRIRVAQAPSGEDVAAYLSVVDAEMGGPTEVPGNRSRTGDGGEER